MAVVTRRASHTHHVPQIGLPHRLPSSSVSPQKTTPTSADEPAKRS